MRLAGVEARDGGAWLEVEVRATSGPGGALAPAWERRRRARRRPLARRPRAAGRLRGAALGRRSTSPSWRRRRCDGGVAVGQPPEGAARVVLDLVAEGVAWGAPDGLAKLELAPAAAAARCPRPSPAGAGRAGPGASRRRDPRVAGGRLAAGRGAGGDGRLRRRRPGALPHERRSSSREPGPDARDRREPLLHHPPAGGPPPGGRAHADQLLRDRRARDRRRTSSTRRAPSWRASAPTSLTLRPSRSPTRTASFDTVLLCEVIEHFVADPVFALGEIHRVLAPGGRLLLTTPNVARAENLHRLAQRQGIYDPYSRFGPHGRHNREYAAGELIELLLGERLRDRALPDPPGPRRPRPRRRLVRRGRRRRGRRLPLRARASRRPGRAGQAGLALPLRRLATRTTSRKPAPTSPTASAPRERDVPRATGQGCAGSTTSAASSPGGGDRRTRNPARSCPATATGARTRDDVRSHDWLRSGAPRGGDGSASSASRAMSPARLTARPSAARIALGVDAAVHGAAGTCRIRRGRRRALTSSRRKNGRRAPGRVLRRDRSGRRAATTRAATQAARRRCPRSILRATMHEQGGDQERRRRGAVAETGSPSGARAGTSQIGSATRRTTRMARSAQSPIARRRSTRRARAPDEDHDARSRRPRQDVDGQLVVARGADFGDRAGRVGVRGGGRRRADRVWRGRRRSPGASS